MQTLSPRFQSTIAPHPKSARAGLTLLEAVMAMTILTITGSALLTAAMSAIQSGSYLSRTVVAEGIADQLADEIAAVGFPRGSNSLPTPGVPRILFNHVDDFSGYDKKPPLDRLNNTLGTEDPSGSPRNAALQPQPGYLGNFRQQVTVERLSPNGTGFDIVSSDTDYRRVTVCVTYQDSSSPEIPLVKRTRILTRVGFTP